MAKRRYWTPAEIRKLRRVYPHTDNEAIGRLLRRSWSAVQNAAIKLGLRKSAAFLASPKCRFQRGMIPWNLGVTGYMGANRTSFGKGNMPHNWRPVGSERINGDGNLERKVREPNRWQTVKDIIWREKRGPIPRGLFVVHKNRNRADFRLRNLVLVSRAENMRRNTYHRYPKEIARLIQLRGALNRQINRREREKQNRGSEKPSVRGNREGQGRGHAAGPRQDDSRPRAGHHQQRQGGNGLYQRRGRKAWDRIHSGRAGRGSAGATTSAG